MHCACVATSGGFSNRDFTGLIDFENCFVLVELQLLKKFAQVDTERVGDAQCACVAVLADFLNMDFKGLIYFKNYVIRTVPMYWSEYMKKFAHVYRKGAWCIAHALQFWQIY
jgi:hypothetical protein